MIKEEFSNQDYDDLVDGLNLETTSRLALNEHHMYGSARLGVKRVDDEILKVILDGSPVVYETVQAGLNDPGYTYYGEEEPGDEEPPSGPEPEPEVFIKYRINRTRGYKQYELTNHLGNVMVTLSDRKVGVPNTAQTHYISYTADVYTAQEYFAFGSPIEERKFSGGDGYRYGFNTQEKTDEISGPGNHNTALFWEYDTRLGRRWNLDPKPVAWESPYAVNRNNPIFISDPLGDYGKNPNQRTARREARAQAKFDRKIVEPLKELETQLINEGMDIEQVISDVQGRADQLADKYQNRGFLHWAIGQPHKNKQSRKEYTSTATGNKVTQKIAIKAYNQTVTNVEVDNERVNDGALVTNGTTTLNAPEGSTVNVQFNPFEVANDLIVSTVAPGRPNAEISSTGGMINDMRGLRDVFIFNQNVTLNNSNAGQIIYRVVNTSANVNDDHWQLKITVTSPLMLNPTPKVVSN